MYSSARNLSIVAHALTCLPNVGAFGPSGPSHLTYPSYGSYSIVFIFAHFHPYTLFRGEWGSKIPKWDRPGGWGVPSESHSRTEPAWP